MALITLAEAKVGMADKYAQYIIDKTQRGSMLMDMLTFDDATSPGTGGSTLVYGFVNTKTPSRAGFRALNTEYDKHQAIRESKTVQVKILGGTYSIDRLLLGTDGAVDELQYQIDEKIMAVKNEFQNSFINGDATGDPLEFDGLDVILTGSDTEFNTAAAIDISTSALMDSNYNEFLDLINSSLNKLKGKASLLLMNNDMMSKMESIARRAGYLTQTEDAFGRKVTGWNGTPFYDMEKYFNGTTEVDIIPTDGATGETDIYAVVLDRPRDGMCGVVPTGSPVIMSYTPDLNEPGVMKDGDVEMPTAIAVKDTRAACVIRRIKIK